MIADFQVHFQKQHWLSSSVALTTKGSLTGENGLSGAVKKEVIKKTTRMLNVTTNLLFAGEKIQHQAIKVIRHKPTSLN